ncbi:MAG: hypothetical protein HQL58_02995 [Magnetococcales bacterium]|nr:hypothetical protein [Magnetococcales bacterium]
MRSVVVIIDGWTDAYDDDTADLRPTWYRLAAVGTTGLVQWSSQLVWYPEESCHWLELFSLDKVFTANHQADPPLGWLQAHAFDKIRSEDGRTWCRLHLTHLYQQRDELLFMSPWRTGQTADECQELAKALANEWQQDGWVVDATVGNGLLLSTQQAFRARTAPLERLERQSLADHLPSGRDGGLLRRLLVTGQMVLNRHTINRYRSASGRMPLNTPWLSGVGAVTNHLAALPLNNSGRCWTTDPVVAGLARLAGYRPILWTAEEDEMAHHLGRMIQDDRHSRLVIHLTTPALLARHGLRQQWRERVAWVDRMVLQPLTGLLDSDHDRLTVCSGYTADEHGLGLPSVAVPYVSATSRQMQRRSFFWQRNKPGQGNAVSPALLMRPGPFTLGDE